MIFVYILILLVVLLNDDDILEQQYEIDDFVNKVKEKIGY